MPHELEPTLVSYGYSFERRLGQGAHGEVWAARRVSDGYPVAVKLLRAELASGGPAARRFAREARIGCELHHPGICRTFDVLLLAPGRPGIVMERLYGTTLGERLASRGVLPLAEVALLMSPLISGLGTAHAEGVVHRDIKPSNIFLPQDSMPPAKLLDFGVARLVSREGPLAASLAELTKSGLLIGTPAYMSPEQIFGQHVNYLTDYFSLGSVIFQCLSGQRPIQGDEPGPILKQLSHGRIPSLAEVRQGLPADVIQQVDGLLSLRAEDRPQDLRELYSCLEHYAVRATGVP